MQIQDRDLKTAIRKNALQFSTRCIKIQFLWENLFYLPNYSEVFAFPFELGSVSSVHMENKLLYLGQQSNLLEENGGCLDLILSNKLTSKYLWEWI